MALDGIILNKLTAELAHSLPAKINKIYQISQTEVLFHLKTPSGKQNLMISCHSVYNRINITQRSYPTPEEPSNFVMVLRKYLEGSSIQNITQGGLDRWCVLDIRRLNTIGDPVYYKLYIELVGKYANIILVDDNDKIVDALKRIPPFENSHRTIQPGAAFKIIDPQLEKSNPYEATSFNPEESLVKQFQGFSKFLETEVLYRLKNGEIFVDIMNEIKQSTLLYIASAEGEGQFHVIEIKHLGKNLSYPLFEGFDALFFHKEEKDRIKQISGDIFRFVRQQLKHYRAKLPKLMDSYEEALDYEKWQTYGNLLYTYNVENTKGEKSITLKSYENDQEVTIPLDEKLDGKANAKKCFNKYQKLKKGKEYLIEQINICKNEIEYFEGIEQQLSLAGFDDAVEIREELVKQGYLKAKNSSIRKRKKKDETPNITRIDLEDGHHIWFGKNNLQNDYLTWHLAHKDYFWFHTKDFHGAHVVCDNTNPDENTIRRCANIAAYYSSGRDSSSVPVNWCQVNQLKKIPGSKSGLVSLSHYKTLYIDPKEE